MLYVYGFVDAGEVPPDLGGGVEAGAVEAVAAADLAALVTDVGPMDDGSLWINGGYHIFRHDIFDYLNEGEDLVEEPFRRLIAARQLVQAHLYCDA